MGTESYDQELQVVRGCDDSRMASLGGPPQEESESAAAPLTLRASTQG